MSNTRKVMPEESVSEVKSENYKEAYCNFARVAITPYDMALAFGRLDPSGKNGVTPNAIMEATITFSPYQFKSLVTSMALILQQWESQFGIINIKEEFLLKARTLDAMQTR